MNGTKLTGKIGRIDNTDLKATCWDIAMAKGWRVVADVITHKNYCDYIDYIKNYDKKLFNSEYRLTEEEFNVLKEVAGCAE